MNRSYSKIRHIQESNSKLEKRRILEMNQPDMLKFDVITKKDIEDCATQHGLDLEQINKKIQEKMDKTFMGCLRLNDPNAPMKCAFMIAQMFLFGEFEELTDKIKKMNECIQDKLMIKY